MSRMLNSRAVLVSYSIILVGLGIVAFSTGYQFRGYYYYSSFYPSQTDVFLGQLLTVLAIAGLIIGPYFGLAGLIAKDRSVWFEANRLIHSHISVPFVAGVALYYGTIGPLPSPRVLTAYIVFVAIATLMGVMASRTVPQTH